MENISKSQFPSTKLLQKNKNRMMSPRILSLALLFNSFSIFSANAEYDKKEETTLENKYVKIILLNPIDEQGCRFTRGAWIKNIYLNGGSKNGLLVDTSIFPNHPAFGFTEEFIPAQELTQRIEGKPVFDKIGVGKVLRPGETRFSDTPLQLFPWTVQTDDTGDIGRTVIYIQKGTEIEGFNFTLTKTVFFNDEAAVTLTDTLENTGKKQVVTQVYIHPFFTLGSTPADCWYTIPVPPKAATGNTSVFFSAVSEAQITVNYFSKEAKWVAVGNRQTGEVVGILSDTEFNTILVWKSETCFAVEPYVSINLAPGEKQSWQWRLITGCGLSKISRVEKNGMTSIERTADGIAVGFLPVQETKDVQILLKILNEKGDLVHEQTGACASATPTKPAKIIFAAPLLPGMKYRVTAEIFHSDKMVASAEEKIF